MRDSDYEFIRSLVYERSRINLGPDKRDLVSARLAKRLRATQIGSISDYCSFLRTPAAAVADEVANLIDVISTNHTRFFRESDHFDFLRSTALPELVARRRAERWSGLRIWSAACASGEEPYTVAIVLAEALGELAPDWPWRIDATDISHRVLDRARAAVYGEEAVAGVMPAPVLHRHFQRGVGAEQGNYRVKAALRAHVFFGHLNLTGRQTAFEEGYHAIFCRNVMIYFDRPTQEELVQRLARCLLPGGYLFTGHSESLTGIRHSLTSVHPAIYRRPPAARP